MTFVFSRVALRLNNLDRPALDKHKGSQKHENSQSHVEAMVIWQERIMRIENNQSVSTMVNENQLEKKQVLY